MKHVKVWCLVLSLLLCLLPLLAMAEEGGPWNCPGCGKENTGKFCTHCGTPRPEVETWICPSCGKENTGKFCTHCGTARGAEPSLSPVPAEKPTEVTSQPAVTPTATPTVISTPPPTVPPTPTPTPTPAAPVVHVPFEGTWDYVGTAESEDMAYAGVFQGALEDQDIDTYTMTIRDGMAYRLGGQDDFGRIEGGRYTWADGLFRVTYPSGQQENRAVLEGDVLYLISSQSTGKRTDLFGMGETDVYQTLVFTRSGKPSIMESVQADVSASQADPHSDFIGFWRASALSRGGSSLPVSELYMGLSDIEVYFSNDMCYLIFLNGNGSVESTYSRYIVADDKFWFSDGNVSNYALTADGILRFEYDYPSGYEILFSRIGSVK